MVDWSQNESHVVVTTDRAVYEAEQLVVCAGAWAGKMLGDIGVELEVSRHVMTWMSPKHPERFGVGTFPIWGLEDPEGYFYYGFPIQPGRVGLKAARHYRGAPIALNEIDRNPNRDDEREIRAALSQFLPDAEGPVLAMSVCMYTNSPDAHFIIDRHPIHSRVVLATGFSGHGFKFAPVIGEILGDLVLEGSSALPVDFLKLSRFDQ